MFDLEGNPIIDPETVVEVDGEQPGSRRLAFPPSWLFHALNGGQWHCHSTMMMEITMAMRSLPSPPTLPRGRCQVAMCPWSAITLLQGMK
jgi:hypothetical protein